MSSTHPIKKAGWRDRETGWSSLDLSSCIGSIGADDTDAGDGDRGVSCTTAMVCVCASESVTSVGVNVLRGGSSAKRGVRSKASTSRARNQTKSSRSGGTLWAKPGNTFFLGVVGDSRT